jgi:hypothetical protein
MNKETHAPFGCKKTWGWRHEDVVESEMRKRGCMFASFQLEYIMSRRKK